MPDRILVCVAWPYANGSLHVGQVAGAYLPPDIFARYQRMMGNEVLMVSGSDAHGTPITITAEQRGQQPEDLVTHYQAEFLDCWERFGVTFDLFTSTHTENHTEVAQDMFLRLLEKGYVYEDTMHQPYCESDGRFLADRYVGGTCPNCGSSNARGDQCEACGRLLDPEDLLDWRCLLCGSAPVIRATKHMFLKLSAFQDQLAEWIRKQSDWRPNVRNFTLASLEAGLKDRPITRDIGWGVPVPVEGYEAKCIYVWFEACIGYLSASVEWAKSRGEEDAWRPFWQEDIPGYYFMGKDNIAFHSIIWPAMLLGYGGLNIPHNVVASEYLNIEGSKLSTSRNWAVWLPDLLKRYDPDAIRYVLTAGGPETSDTDFSWEEFVRRNNDELVATYGNLVNRVLTLTYRRFDGRVPEPGELDEADRQLLENAAQTLEDVGASLQSCRFRAALGQAMALAQSVNRYLDRKAPWSAVDSDPQDAGRTLWTCINVINCLKTVLYPILPFSSEELHTMLGLPGTVQDQGWKWSQEDVAPGQQFSRPEALFTKLDDSIIEEESGRLGVPV